jgi:hypothetical protein
MRLTYAALLIALTGSTLIGGMVDTARADPYRWCAMYRAKGATNCYFVTLDQCRAAISGMGGFCQPNNFYDGRPVLTAEDGVRRGRSRVH